MLDIRYNEKGPFWAARFLPWSQKQTSYCNSLKLEKMDGTKSLPFISHFVIGYHHGITDGHTCFRIMRMLLELLDDVIKEKAVDDEIQLSTLLDRKDEIRLLEEIETELVCNKELFKIRNDEHQNPMVDALIDQGYPVPLKNKKETVSLPYILDRESTKAFAAKCKKEGLTFHTGFTAVIDAAFVKLLRDANVEQDVYKILSVHSVNQRKYYNDCENSFGNGFGMLDMTMEAPKNVLDNFWNYGRQVHSVLKSRYQKKITLERHVLGKLSGASPLIPLDMKQVTENHLPKLVTYTTTNMLDVSHLVGNCTENVSLDYFDRITSIFDFPTLWLSGFQTINGQLMHSMQYNRNLIDTPVAQKMSDNIFAILKQVSNSE